MKNCQESLELLYDIIDKQASDIDVREVKEHLENCHECLEKYELEESVQKFLMTRCEGLNTACCVDKLKTKIQGKLDELDGNVSAPENPRPFFRRTAGLITVAASILILITAGFIGNGFYHHSQTYIPVESSHWAAVDNVEAFDDGEVTFATLKRLHDEHKYDVEYETHGYTLVGAKQEHIMSVPMDHFVYQKDDDVVSVFMTSANQFSIPDELKSTQVVRDGVTFFDHHCRGCRLVYHQYNDLIIITATVNHETDLLQFVPGRGAI